VKERRGFSKRCTAFVFPLFDTGLGIIRSLGRHGVPVIGCDFNSKMPGIRSRYCCKSLICPSPVLEPEKLLDFLVAEGRKLSAPGIFFPASDAFVLFVSRYRDELASYYRFILPSKKIIESIVNKKEQYELAKKTGIPVPDTLFPKTYSDVKNLKNSISYPVFIKPCYSYKWQETYPSIKGFCATGEDELATLLNGIIASGMEVMVQSIINGPNTNHFKVCAYINNEGTVLAVFTLRKIRQYPTEFGVGSCVESVHNDELKELGLKFFKGINYCGVGSIEFKRDIRDGKFKLIELNPRYWQQNSLSTTCGINFPLIQYLDLTGQNPEPRTQFKEGIKWLDAIADFQSFWSYFKQKELTLWNWMTSFRNVKSFATFAIDDIRPFLRSNAFGWKYLKLPLYLWNHRRQND